ncbi:MAG: hypothetical protein K8I30_06935 [Anaerolineae bacterium]|nr:hypothetical protein [Anaerolineae bacterium]
MLLATINAIFAMGALAIAIQAARKGIPFVRDGWTLIQTQTRHEDFRHNVERRRAISDGGRFLVGGALWLITGSAALAAAIYFGVQAFSIVYFS